MNFLQDCIDLFTGTRSSHMGAHYYAMHQGQRNGVSTSGDRLWAEIEANYSSSDGSLTDRETLLLRKVSTEINSYLQIGTAIIDLGSGTHLAFENKILPLALALQSAQYVAVDESSTLLMDISSTNKLPSNLKVLPVMDNMLHGDHAYCEDVALVCLFGNTIGNIEHPLSKELPLHALVRDLLKLTAAANSGAFLVTFDSNQNGEEVLGYYKPHKAFNLNVFDRLALEPHVKGFIPETFEYKPIWIDSSGQLAHVVHSTQDQAFSIGNREILVKKGQDYHLKNSYRFTPAFFECACNMAGLKIIRSWSDTSTSNAYLLQIPAIQIGQRISKSA